MARPAPPSNPAAPADPAALAVEADLATTRADPEPWLGSAEVYLDYDEPGEAARLLRELLAGPVLDILEEADARHLLGHACDDKGDRKGMVKEWLAVLRLDAAGDEPQHGEPL